MRKKETENFDIEFPSNAAVPKKKKKEKRTHTEGFRILPAHFAESCTSAGIIYLVGVLEDNGHVFIMSQHMNN